MAAAPVPTLSITGPDGHPQPVSLIPLPPTAAELALLLKFLSPDVDIAPPGPLEVPAAGKFFSCHTNALKGASNEKTLTIREIMAKMRRKIEADIERNQERRRAAFLNKKKRRIPTDELAAAGLVKKMNYIR
ncbi:hypothetical protein FMEXI_13206 [Fusarium mexicanum]|uniref:Uncharacterized protein n=1 Tax=Fusarium mexicanum TaxID=751941 RepID=A0A8H5I5Z4_9HYPO|nr:hypothetical protein FMEXI_13206 [Fusarium mexicanum]